jgi:hypothetical protein
LRIKLLVVLILSLLSFEAYSNTSNSNDAYENEATLWPMITLEQPLYKDKVSAYLYLQPTMTDDFTAPVPFVYRGALIYSPNKAVDLWAGFDQHYSYVDGPQLLENRLWQQVSVDNKIKKLGVNNRLRIEERFLTGIAETSFRLRYRMRFTYPLSKDKRWYAATSDELLINLNTVSSQRRSGFAENRLYLGVGRKINDYMNLEGGYQMGLVDLGRGTDLIRHSIVVNMSFVMPQLTGKSKAAQKTLDARVIQQGPN